MLKLPTMPSLETTLKLDSLICALSGIDLVLASQPIARLVTLTPVVFGLTLAHELEILGFGLITAAIAIYFIAVRRPINPVAVWSIIFLEAIWIVESAILLFWANDVLTLVGKELITVSAIAVLVFMLLEIHGLNVMQRSKAN